MRGDLVFTHNAHWPKYGHLFSTIRYVLTENNFLQAIIFNLLSKKKRLFRVAQIRLRLGLHCSAD